MKSLSPPTMILQQRIAVAAEILPVAVSPVDRNRAEGRGQLDDGLDIGQRLLHLEAVVLLAVGALLPGFGQTGVEVFKIPVQGYGGLLFAAALLHGVFLKIQAISDCNTPGSKCCSM
ncbi:MAG: hypothetical protein NTZ64_13345 [Polaromonas sp.]|nr:hypothetical protein [Polaromonas sp.]